MVESVVNISAIHHKRPNIFELVAQESLISHIHPALKILCTYASQKNSMIVDSILKWYEEVFFGANLALQYFYLKAFSASFSESFYGLKRIKAFSETTRGKLPRTAFIASLLCLTVIPYLKQKLSSLVEASEEEGISEERKKLLRRIIIFNRYINTIYGAMRLYYITSYAAGFAKVHDPLLRLCGVELIYHHRNMPSWKDICNTLFSSKASTPKVALKSALKLAASSLEIFAFFIQFLSWWHSGESKLGNLTKLPVPKAPHINNGSVFCPICLHQRKNEVVLITSGYVFCYLCIKEFLDKNGICPVTNLPSSVHNLVRLYSTNNI